MLGITVPTPSLRQRRLWHHHCADRRKGYESADDWAALFACVVILFNGCRILRAALNEIMDAAVPGQVQKDIREISCSVPRVVRIEKCRTRKSGLGLCVEIHVEVDGDLTVRRGHEIAHEVSDRLKLSSLSIQHVVVHIEPALVEVAVRAPAPE